MLFILKLFVPARDINSLDSPLVKIRQVAKFSRSNQKHYYYGLDTYITVDKTIYSPFLHVSKI